MPRFTSTDFPAPCSSTGVLNRLCVVCLASYADARHTLGRLVLRLQQQPRRRLTASHPTGLRICLLGSDALIACVLRAYVDQLSSRPSELAAALRFYPIPITGLLFGLAVTPITSPEENKVSADLGRTMIKLPSEITLQNCHAELLKKMGKPHPLPSSAISAITAYNTLACYLCQVDTLYACLFGELASGPRLDSSASSLPTPVPRSGSQDVICQASEQEAPPNGIEVSDYMDTVSEFMPHTAESLPEPQPNMISLVREWPLLSRVFFYLSTSQYFLPLPIGECLVSLGSGGSFGLGFTQVGGCSLGIFGNSESICPVSGMPIDRLTPGECSFFSSLITSSTYAACNVNEPAVTGNLFFHIILL
ncbi:unnamed protein product [Protopolystoma xenopodis]|uniref:Phosphofurin acidic cluster sorting protein 1/2 C-terminal domain-containing protein n=1 Tax=Protopolystoma xenopodis TaxID=117903 RepID=A0A3S5AFI7_9PLAT|nr:unnamed protein product [Protopolystoma xenopodis]